MAQARKYPIGIQTFSEIRERNYLYIDKTQYLVDFIDKGYKYVFLSRPRRFGKSLFASMIHAYYEGRKDLFEGLAMGEYEKDWVKHPVLHFDMSAAKHMDKDMLERYLADMLTDQEAVFGYKSEKQDPNIRLKDLVVTANRLTGRKVALIIDEYDAPLLDVVHEELNLVALRRAMQNFYSPIKSLDPYLEFVFLTGITKFAQLSIFSELNNLFNISMYDKYSAICGISSEELHTQMLPDVERLAEHLHLSVDETFERLKRKYDGYHFSHDNMVDVFNPFSLINALADSKLRNYWASSGATSMLPKFVDDMEIRLKDFDHCALISTTIETSDVTGGGPELFLYQSGYLTIKDYQMGVYILGFPNQEVRQALYETVLPALTLRSNSNIQSVQSGLLLALQLGNLPEAMKCLKALVADVPYSNKKLASMDMEERYRLILSTIFNAIGCRVEVEKMIATGRIDMVVETIHIIYVLELKLSNNGGIDAAAEQIRSRQYAEPFKADKRRVVALAIELDDKGKGLIDWKEV